MPRVVYIAGAGRSGSTILHHVLGQVDGFAAVGELRDVWGRAALRNTTCGCGLTFRECPFWGEVMDRILGGLDLDDVRRISALTETVRTRTLPLMSTPPTRRLELARLGAYLTELSRLYAAIADVSGCPTIVDSSKNPAYGYLLRHVDGVEPVFVQIVRDAPAVAYAWTRHVESEPGFQMARKSPTDSALEWVARNAAAELYLRRGSTHWMLLRYEDFVEDPRTAVRSILARLDRPDAALPFVSSHEVELRRRSHSVAGNRVRFQDGPVTVAADERWRTALPAWQRRTVAALTWPLRVRYGYPARAHR